MLCGTHIGFVTPFITFFPQKTGINVACLPTTSPRRNGARRCSVVVALLWKSRLSPRAVAFILSMMPNAGYLKWRMFKWRWVKRKKGRELSPERYGRGIGWAWEGDKQVGTGGGERIALRRHQWLNPPGMMVPASQQIPYFHVAGYYFFSQWQLSWPVYLVINSLKIRVWLMKW